MLMLVAASMMSLPDEGVPIAVSEGGFCAGIAWITAESAEGLTYDRGPDFRVYRYDGSDGVYWGVYSGNAAAVSGAQRRQLFRRHGITVNAITIDGEFNGYLAKDRRGWQNHFFGSVFKNDPSDISFFKRVDFGPAGRAKCKRHPQP